MYCCYSAPANYRVVHLVILIEIHVFQLGVLSLQGVVSDNYSTYIEIIKL